MARILVTGSAGFIGSSLVRRLVALGHEVVGVDDFNPYFFTVLKRARDADLRKLSSFKSIETDVSDLAALESVFASHPIELVVHLAAQAGVRYSLKNPFIYERSNVAGFLNVLELSRRYKVKRVVYASSSSVYGNREATPCKEDDRVDNPVSLYAATKRADELIAHSYAYVYGMDIVGLRYFTVYGPWGRPDMAVWIFTERILASEPIPIFNDGRMWRDFTYIDDIVDGTLSVLFASGIKGHDVYNIGAGRCVELGAVIRTLEEALGRKAVLDPKPLEPGDVLATWADVSKLKRLTGYSPKTPIEVGIPAFVGWYLAHPDITEAVRKERSNGKEQR